MRNRLAMTSGTYMAQVDAMFAEVKEDFEEIGRQFIIAAAEEVISTTPGPDLQYALTEYIATGRLRAGWNFGEQAPLSVSDVTGGPYDTSRGGELTISRIEGEVLSVPLPRKSALWNEVGYGYYVHEGLENHTHIGPRLWVDSAGTQGEEYLRIAMSRVGVER